MSHIVSEPTGTVASGDSALQEGVGCTGRRVTSPVAKIRSALFLRLTEKFAQVWRYVWACCHVGVRDKMAHSLNLRNSFFPMFSSELDRDRELMKGEVDGWVSVGTSEGGGVREERVRWRRYSRNDTWSRWSEITPRPTVICNYTVYKIRFYCSRLKLYTISTLNWDNLMKCWVFLHSHTKETTYNNMSPGKVLK